jgi:hypothetical protein
MSTVNLSEHIANKCPDLLAQLRSLCIPYGPFVIAIDSNETGFSVATHQIDLTDLAGDDLADCINAHYDDIDWIDDRKKDKETNSI